MANDEVKLSAGERIMLANQYRILEALYPREAESYRQYREIVETGYELHYSELNMGVAEGSVSRDISTEVMDVLDMFSALKYSFEGLNDKTGVDSDSLQFPGFDGNNAPNHLSYARFLILELGRWPEIIEDRPGFDLNSHAGLEESYRRMLVAWESLGKKNRLTLEEIEQIQLAQIHPDSR